ncbi:peptidase [Snodgrassella alvi]|uniref:Peptidase n=1 Tax=Snodgrassella alvi TaxID=1196083 RepID=A0A2N9XZS9_9NEIS|nr:peptidase [Snodgrassella alvi]PIT57423.1 peptidase [Snodgrassella alvi]
MSTTDEKIIAACRHWLEQAVIGLNLCPFARKPYNLNRLRFTLSHARHLDAYLELLEQEILLLLQTPAIEIETTLIIEPQLFTDFDVFLDAATLAEQVLQDVNADGTIQIAPFHPDFQFADEPYNDISNYTNRSPYPILHLIRESSIDQAVAAFPDAATIYERNKALLRRMGAEGWAKLGIEYPIRKQK